MTHKQHAITLIRPWPQTSSLKAHFHELMANLKRIVEIPTGYQDENGFHYGAEPAKVEVQWPPA